MTIDRARIDTEGLQQDLEWVSFGLGCAFGGAAGVILGAVAAVVFW